MSSARARSYQRKTMFPGTLSSSSSIVGHPEFGEAPDGVRIGHACQIVADCPLDWLAARLGSGQCVLWDLFWLGQKIAAKRAHQAAGAHRILQGAARVVDPLRQEIAQLVGGGQHRLTHADLWF